MKTKIVSCNTADSKPVKQEVNGTVTFPPLEFPGQSYSGTCLKFCRMRLETSNKHYIKLKKSVTLLVWPKGDGATTLSIMTLSITTLSLTTLSITTLDVE
jgi:hypothetical protein